MAIRYDKKLNSEINRTIRNFNQKIRRLEKLESDLILPEKITKKALKEDVYTRAELKRKLKQLQRYSTRGIEKTMTTTSGEKISKYEYINIKKESARVKRKLTMELKKLETKRVKIGGIEQDMFGLQTERYSNLKARREALNKKLDTLNSEQLKQYKKLLAKSNRANIYVDHKFKTNYLEILTDLGYFYGYDNKKLEEIKNKIYKLKDKYFVDLFNNDRAIKSILDYYPFITKTNGRFNQDDLANDVFNLYDILYENIDMILKDYA